MSNLTTAIQSIKPQIEIDAEGKVSITRSGLADFLEVSHVFLSPSVISKKLATALATVGFDAVSIKAGEYLSEVVVSKILFYYSTDARKTNTRARDLLEVMTSIGLRAYFQSELGWQPVEAKPDPNAALRNLIASAQKLLEVEDYASDKPGLKSIVDEAGQFTQAQLPGIVSLGQFLAAEYPGRTFSQPEMCHIGSFVATSYRNVYGCSPVKKAFKVVSGKTGKSYYQYQPAYPADFVPYMRNVIELGLGSAN